VLAEEQAALRRVATLVAGGAPPEKVFAAVTEEVGQVFAVDIAAMGRYEPDGTAISVAAWGEAVTRFPVGSRWRLGGKNVTTMVFQTGRPARVDLFAEASGQVGIAGREGGTRSSIGTPIVVEGRLWGVMAVGSSGERPLPSDTEARLASFTELLATAIANAESRAGLARLAEEQAALRRVATVAARGASPEEVFAAVTEEVGQLLPVDFADMGRYEADDTLIFLASWGRTRALYPVGARLKLGGKNLATMVLETGSPVRVDTLADASGSVGVPAREGGVRSAVATPVIVERRLWGVMAAGSSGGQQLPADTEARMAQFTELLATAIANAEGRAGLARLADEQAALRRVATLVARGAPQEEVFTTVTREVGQLLPVELALMGRYETDDAVSFICTWTTAADRQVPARVALGGKNLATIVARTGAPARIDTDTEFSGSLGEHARGLGVRSAVAAPIIVAGGLWGVMIAASTAAEQLLPANTEARLDSFTALVAMAIANAESRADLAASRARIVAAADDTRRRIERDLHDGTQQQLVSLMLDLRAARTTQPPEVGELSAQLAATERTLAGVLGELREISRGIHPAILSRGGLAPALRVLAHRSPAPVELDLHTDRRLPEHVEVAAYFVVSEALTNAAKHANASFVNVELEANDEIARLSIRDDGIGGADPARGSGLVGLCDRIEALGGTLEVTSPAGSGTTLLIEIPLAVSPAA
jgi:signal transduction histidine kinase